MKTRSFRNIILSYLAFLSMTTAVSAQEYGEGNTCCEPCSADIGRFSVGADWLYWKTAEDGLNYGLLTTSSSVITTDPATSGTITTITPDQKILKPHFKYDSGYRVYAGYEFPCYDWEIDVIYTHAPQSLARNSYLVVPMPDLIPPLTQTITILQNSLFNFDGTFPAPSPVAVTVLGPLIPVFVGNAVKTEWLSDFDYVDFDLAHMLCLTDYLIVRPHFGVRYLWAKQSFKIDFAATKAAGGIILGHPSFETIAAFLKNRTHGVGVEGGLWGDCKVGYGFSIIGHIGGSILYGKHKINGSKVITVNTAITNTGVTVPVTTITNSSYRDIEHTAIPMMDYFIGLQYEACISEVEVNFHVGWEQHIAYDMNRFTTTDGGDLSLQGLTLGGGFAF